jgi:hypothetical protein
MCVRDAQGMVLFIDEMKSIATQEKMEYRDGSEDTKRGLEIIGDAGARRVDGSPLINILVERRDGLGVTAVNVSLPGYQIALGFLLGANELEAQQFLEKVVKRLRQHWRVDVLPSGSSIEPDQSCK